MTELDLNELERLVANIEAEVMEFITGYPDLARTIGDTLLLITSWREQREQLAAKDAEIERLRGRVKWLEEVAGEGQDLVKIPKEGKDV